jgi:hypothetical protein
MTDILHRSVMEELRLTTTELERALRADLATFGRCGVIVEGVPPVPRPASQAELTRHFSEAP